MDKSRISDTDKLLLISCVKIGVIKELYSRRVITREQFERLMKQQSIKQIAV